MRIDRMLAITVMLLNRERISARELSAKFEVSVRTIYRDIDAINLAGIPIISYSGSNGGFGIMENFKIDRQLLTPKEMQGILTALKGVSSTLDHIGIDTAIEKIQNLVPSEKSAELQTENEDIVLNLTPWGYPQKQREYLRIIQKSINQRTLIEMSYTNASGISTERTIEPMTLILQGYTWYLFGYCQVKSDFRIFRVNRIKKIAPNNTTFERKDESYKKHMDFDNDSRAKVDLVLKFSPNAVNRIHDYFDEEQIEKYPEGYFIVKVTFPEDEWVYATILSYGEDVEVLKPEYIRKIIREKAKKTAEKYKADTTVSQE